MTREEMEKEYGEAKVVFDYYYKYTFTFVGDYKGKRIVANLGGNPDDIYKEEVDNMPVSITALMPNDVSVDGVMVFSED